MDSVDMALLPERTDAQIAADRMASVERQLHQKIPPGIPRSILCPYCSSWNFPHRQFCCDTLRQAVVTVLMCDRALKVAEAAERAMDN